MSAKEITVKEVLEKLAVDGKLDLEYLDDTVVFWKKSDEMLLLLLKDKATAVRTATAEQLKSWETKDDRIRAGLAEFNSNEGKKTAPPKEDF